MFFLIKYMIICLFMTILIETLIALIIGIRNKKDFINIILVNFMTNPLVVSIPVYFNIVYNANYRNISYIILEVFAFVTEGFVYKRTLNFKKINPYLVSFILNIVSLVCGEIIGRI